MDVSSTDASGFELQIEYPDRLLPLRLENPHLVVAGYTGRDTAAVARHVAELQKEGIAPPTAFPLFWVLPNWLLLVGGATVQVASGMTSGEIEPVLVRLASGDLFVTVGSDHTDRALEKSSISLAKLTCPKVIAPIAWPFAAVSDHWDTLRLSSEASGMAQPYQDGTLALIRRPRELLDAVDRLELDPTRPLVLFLGTIPLQTEGFIFDSAFSGMLQDDARDRAIRCAYGVEAVDLERVMEGVAVPVQTHDGAAEAFVDAG